MKTAIIGAGSIGGFLPAGRVGSTGYLGMGDMVVTRCYREAVAKNALGPFSVRGRQPKGGNA